jgi:hypothetical protein
VARRGTYRVLLSKPEGKDLGVDERIILKTDLEKM